MDIGKQAIEYQRKIFSIRQVRDCVDGSDTIKRSGEWYLPMPSGMVGVPPASVTGSGQSNTLSDKTLSVTQAPWYHGNPAYSAYVHRAKFPDITNGTLRGLIGVATRKDAEVTLPSSIAYMEDLTTMTGDDVYALFQHSVSEILQSGRLALVLDVRSDNTLYVAQYSSESYINWEFEVVDGRRVQTYAEFEMTTVVNEENIKKTLVYRLILNEAGALVCVVEHYTNGHMSEAGPQEIMVQGKTLNFIPLVNVGAEKNTAEPDAIPLLGVSDCALDIYRHSADLNQAQFMTCNPTLVFTGVDSDAAPSVVGSAVAIALSDPQSNAFYLKTDTSALSHINEYTQNVFQEAVQYGSSLMGPSKRAAESAEALSLRQASSGATLITVVTCVGDGIEDILQMAATLTGGTGEVEFNPNIDFADVVLTPQGITALVASWMNGAITHLTLLENFSQAGILAERTPEEELDAIEEETPSLITPTQTAAAEGMDDESRNTEE